MNRLLRTSSTLYPLLPLASITLIGGIDTENPPIDWNAFADIMFDTY